MKVIFLDKVNEYKKGETAEVKDGYARNYLFRKNLAVLATKENTEHAKELQAEAEKKHNELMREIQEVAAKLAKEKLEFLRKSEDQQKIFGAVTNADIAEHLAELGYSVEKKDIETEPISDTGEHKVRVDLGEGIKAELVIKVIPE